MKRHIVLMVFVVKLAAYAMLLTLLLAMLVSKLGAAEIDVEQLNKHLEQVGDPPSYTTVPYPSAGPNGVTYVLNPDGSVSVGPNQCLRPDGNVTIAKPVLDRAEVTMVDPDSTKITYPPKLVRIHRVPFDGKRSVLHWENGWDMGKHHEPAKLHIQTHHFLQVDDAGKEVDAFWDESLPEDPEPKPDPEHSQHIDDKGFFRWDDNNRICGPGDGHHSLDRLDTELAVANGGTGISGPPIPLAKVSITGPLSGGEPEHLTSVDPDGGPLQSAAPSPRLLFWYFACLLVGFLAGVGAYRIRARK